MKSTKMKLVGVQRPQAQQLQSPVQSKEGEDSLGRKKIEKSKLGVSHAADTNRNNNKPSKENNDDERSGILHDVTFSLLSKGGNITKSTTSSLPFKIDLNDRLGSLNVKKGSEQVHLFSSNIYVDTEFNSESSHNVSMDLYWFVGFVLIIYTIVVLTVLKLKQRYCKRPFIVRV